jgi:chromosome segregation ATPase
MFNLFPKKKFVDEILEDSGIKPYNINIAIEYNNLLTEVLKLRKENQELKNDWHQPELCKEKIHKLEEEIKAWEKDWDKQNQNIKELQDKINKLVSEKIKIQNDNGKLNSQIVAYQKIVEGASETIDTLKKENADFKTKHPMYPIHWGGWDKEENQAKQKDVYGIEPEYYDNKIKEKSWEEAASDLALRVVKLEKLLADNPQSNQNQKPIDNNKPKIENLICDKCNKDSGIPIVLHNIMPDADLKCLACKHNLKKEKEKE